MYSKEKPNKLINEKSPYLLQHAHNPINWHPWGTEAFDKAFRENKPIFLSIGYSTCHWCHVMERESFEDSEVAEIFNKYFVCMKVDREERPDIDSIYMKACQLMTGRGGWPLSIFMTPDQKPFYTATYIPKHRRYGMLGIVDLGHRIHQLWKDDPDSVMDFAKGLTDSISQSKETEKVSLKESKIAKRCFESLVASYDEKHGGFSKSPKFPTPQNLMFLMRYYAINKENLALEMVEKTLDAMLKGGIYDHMGGGFSRYSTDHKWLVPHFEKMLYDNALLAICYAECHQIKAKKVYETAVFELMDYIKREMTYKKGGFFSAEDADSEGVEGKYYVWSQEEIIHILGEEIGLEFCKAYDITEKGNFEGKNIPNLIENSRWEAAFNNNKEDRKKLLQYRDKRIHPHKDDKILTGWNGLMITAFAICGKVFNREDFIETGKAAFEFIETNLIEKNERLYARFRQGERRYRGYLDDYSFMLWAALELHESTGNKKYLDRAHWYGSELIRLFWDNENGGLFFNGNDSEKLLTNPKEAYDNALPSGNSMAAYNLIRLGRLTDDEIIGKYGEKIIESFSKGLDDIPQAYAFMVNALMMKESPYIKTVLAGKGKDEVFIESRAKLSRLFMPFLTKLIIDTSLKEKGYEEYKKNEETILYICKNFSCEPIIKEKDILEEIDKFNRISN